MEAIKVSRFGAIPVHLVCGLGLAVAFWAAHHVFAVNLLSHPEPTLFILWVIQCPIVILVYSLFRQNPAKCSYLKAVARGLLGLAAGALVIAFGAITLGAPVGMKFIVTTLYWSLLMSLFTFAPAASVFGSSWQDWQRIFAKTRPASPVDYLVCHPAHGAVLGSWFGAWPMPLDWERPWQEWPICVTYGAIFGYIMGMLLAIFFIFHSGKKLSKEE